LEIFNLNGVLLNSVVGKNEIETNNLLPGFYCVKLSNPNKTTKSFFVKQ
jgi:hypothetical protein